MPISKYRKGADKERRIVNRERNKGFLCFRSAGSHSPVDIFSLDPVSKTIFLIQSKGAFMAQRDKDKIKKELEEYEGTYIVCVVVE